MERNLKYLRGKHIKVIELYFYKKKEQPRIKEIQATYKIPEKYQIVGKDTLVGDIVVFYENKIGVIDHEIPKENPLTIVKKIPEFCDFVDELEKFSGYSEEDGRKKLKKAKKELKALKKMAPKNLKYHFEGEIYDVEDLIDDLEYEAE